MLGFKSCLKAFSTFTVLNVWVNDILVVAHVRVKQPQLMPCMIFLLLFLMDYLRSIFIAAH